jgi:molybdopterin synthase catalytic subunit
MQPTVGIQPTPLSVDQVIAAVAHPGAGGTAVFIGTVRDHDQRADRGSDQPVSQLEYSAHPNAERELQRVGKAVAAKFPDVRLAAVHRSGVLDVGDIAVVVAAAAPHRAAAFEAARQLIDDLKAAVPIWKHQTFSDGSDEWVGLP